MNPRYLATYRTFGDTGLETHTQLVGRFAAAESAQAEARRKFNVPGSEVLEVRAETRIQAGLYVLGRWLIRALRVAAGVTIAVVGYALIWDNAVHMGNTPLGSITLDQLVKAAFRGGLTMAAWGLAWLIAFGDGPDAKY